MTEAVSVWSCLLQSVYAPRDAGGVSVVGSAAVCVRASRRRWCQCGRVCCSLCTRIVTEAVQRVDLDLVLSCLAHVPDIPESTLVVILKFFIRRARVKLDGFLSI